MLKLAHLIDSPKGLYIYYVITKGGTDGSLTLIMLDDMGECGISTFDDVSIKSIGHVAEYDREIFGIPVVVVAFVTVLD